MYATVSNGARLPTFQADVGSFALWISRNEVNDDNDLRRLRSALLEIPGFECLQAIDDMTQALPRRGGFTSNGELRLSAIHSYHWCYVAQKYLFFDRGHLRELMEHCGNMIRNVQTLRNQILQLYRLFDIPGTSSLADCLDQLGVTFKILQVAVDKKCPDRESDQQIETAYSVESYDGSAFSTAEKLVSSRTSGLMADSDAYSAEMSRQQSSDRSAATGFLNDPSVPSTSSCQKLPSRSISGRLSRLFESRRGSEKQTKGKKKKDQS